ncbi:MAG: Mut7-C RNAse domain-containing protein [Aggregatilineales bacterium]
MNIATFHFHGALNFFLSRRQKNKPVMQEFDRRASIKDMIESIAPPHPEIALIVVNGVSVGFDYIVQDGDVVDVYPDFDAVELSNKVALIPPYPQRPKFILDTHLGRLAAYLRMMGYDTLYRNDYPDDELAEVSHDETRILLTRDVGLLKRNPVIYGYFVREIHPRERLIEISSRYGLVADMQPFKHCMSCNGHLVSIEKADLTGQVKETILETYDLFHQCQSCEKIFWKGSHYVKMQALLEDVIAETS